MQTRLFLELFCNHLERLKNLEEGSDFTFDNLSRKYKISPEEYGECLRKTKKIFYNINAGSVDFFLKTRLNVKKYTRARGSSYLDDSLVMSNKDGSKKVYFTTFNMLSDNDSKGFLKILKQKNENIKFFTRVRL